MFFNPDTCGGEGQDFGDDEDDNLRLTT